MRLAKHRNTLANVPYLSFKRRRIRFVLGLVDANAVSNELIFVNKPCQRVNQTCFPSELYCITERISCESILFLEAIYIIEKGCVILLNRGVSFHFIF